MRVLLTGATGFLGAYLVRALSPRHALRALARARSETGAIEEAGVEIVRGGFDEPDVLRAALRDVDAIVHAAGGGLARRVEELYDANTASTRALVGAAPSGLRRFVLVSSLAAHGPSRAGRPAREGEPDAPRSHYGRSKLAAERALLATPLSAVVVRPPALYGPGEHRMLQLFRAARRGVVPMVHPGGTLSLLHGEDCARAVAAALEAPAARGVYYVAEPRVYGRREMAELIARALGKRARVLAVPEDALAALGSGLELAGALRGRVGVLTRDKVRDLRQPHQCCDPSRAIGELGWSAVHDFERGAREAYEDYRRRGWL